MHVGIDARRWILPQVSGIGTHALALIEVLPRVAATTSTSWPTIRDRIMMVVLRAAGPRFSAPDLPFSPFSPAGQLVLLPRLGAMQPGKLIILVGR